MQTFKEELQMKQKALLTLSLLSFLTLTGCSLISKRTSSNSSSNGNSSISENTGSDYDYNSSISIEEPEDIEVEDNTGEFSIKTSDGIYEQNGNIYRITAAGTYTLKGYLEGQILVEAGENDEVVIELSGATIINSEDSPIKALTADKVEISAKKETGNTITDNRSAKIVDTSTLGEGAIYAKTDLKLKGTGKLVVTGNYNNGVHTSKD